MNTEKIKAQVKKAIDRFGKDVEIKRNSVNEFGEPSGEALVTIIKGYYHKGSSFIGINITEGAKVTTNRTEMLMIVLDEEGQKVQEGDFFTLNSVKYEIVDLGNNFDIYNDMSLKRG